MGRRRPLALRGVAGPEMADAILAAVLDPDAPAELLIAGAEV